MSNIAEGFERNSDPQFRHFIVIAKGSCGEVRAQLYIALDQAYISPDTFAAITTEAETVSRRLSAFEKRLRPPPKPFLKP